ncbi:glycerophosphodiester phosphodiesterase [Pedobacter sp.]|nr:glycerophosphodiester phosphodiesterase [Candidatus Saccharibacteria bacterium]
MLIIGHRGSAGTKAENSIAGLREAIRVGADMVEIDIRITKDKQAVLAHDFHLYRSYKKIDLISRSTLLELQKRSGGTEAPIVTLKQAVKECYGKIFMNIEVKRSHAVGPVLEVLKGVCKEKEDWESIIISSLNPLILKRFRNKESDIQLAMIHHINPLDFIIWQRQLKLSAVGFHRLNINNFALQVAKELGLFTYVYTVNRPETAKRLESRDIDAIVTDYPERLIENLSKKNR